MVTEQDVCVSRLSSRALAARSSSVRAACRLFVFTSPLIPVSEQHPPGEGPRGGGGGFQSAGQQLRRTDLNLRARTDTLAGNVLLGTFDFFLDHL